MIGSSGLHETMTTVFRMMRVQIEEPAAADDNLCFDDRRVAPARVNIEDQRLSVGARARRTSISEIDTTDAGTESMYVVYSYRGPSPSYRDPSPS